MKCIEHDDYLFNQHCIKTLNKNDEFFKIINNDSYKNTLLKVIKYVNEKIFNEIENTDIINKYIKIYNDFFKDSLIDKKGNKIIITINNIKYDIILKLTQFIY